MQIVYYKTRIYITTNNKYNYIQKRIKSWHRVQEKIEGNIKEGNIDYMDILTNPDKILRDRVKDLIGLRIVCLYLDDLKDICSFIFENFNHFPLRIIFIGIENQPGFRVDIPYLFAVDVIGFFMDTF